MSTAPLSKFAPKPFRLIWWQAGKVARIDCTFLTMQIHETDLPYAPAVAPVSLVNGEFDILPPTPVQAEQLRLGNKYWVRVRLVDGTGAGVETQVFQIMVTG